MHAGQVISLKVIVDVGFPIALHVVDAALEQLHLAERKFLGLHRKRSQTRPQRWGMRIKIHKHEIEPFLDAHWNERELLRTKSLEAFDLGRADERTVEVIGPSVIAAAKKFARTAAFCRRPGPVPADVVKTSQDSVDSSHEDQRLT